jgi:hypothetical protein
MQLSIIALATRTAMLAADPRCWADKRRSERSSKVTGHI